MGDSDDDQVEVLDVGGRLRRERDGPDEYPLPPMELDAATQIAAERTPAWRSLAAGVLAMAVTTAAAVITMNVRHDAAGEAAAAEVVNIVVGEVEVMGPGADVTTLQLRVYNAGPRDVDVLWLAPTSWNLAADRDPVERTVSSGSWTLMTAHVIPDCEGAPTPPTIAAAVRTEAGEQEVVLPVASGNSGLEWAHSAACHTQDARVWLDVLGGEVVDSADDDVRMLLRIFAHSWMTDADVEITDVVSEVPGFVVAGVDLPASVHAGDEGQSMEVEVVWRVEDCELATTFEDGSIAFDVDVKSEAEPIQVVDGYDVRIPVAELARFAVAFCLP